MNGKKLVRGTILTVLCMVGMLYFNSSVSKAYWVVVLSNNTNVRNSASTGSDVMTVVNAGDRLDVYSEEQDAEGKTWYKVTINNASGYVRSDTVQKEEEADGSVAASAQIEPVASSDVETIPSQAATVKQDNVNVRSSASTSGGVVAKLSSGAAVTLTGTASDSEGNTWYQVNFINNGSNVTGYIRNDFVEPGEIVGDTGEGTEEGGEDELADIYGDMPAEDNSVSTPNNDYELFFEADQEGVDCWYIHDNIAQKRYKLEQLMRADEMNTQNLEIKDKEIAKMKIAVIVLAVLFVFALLAAGFFGFKYHDARDGDDDDEDDDDDDDDFQEAPPVRRRADTEAGAKSRSREAVRSEERGARTVQRRPETAPQRRPAPAAGTQRRSEAEGRTVARSPQARRPEAEIQRRPAQSGTRTRTAAPAQPVRRPSAPSESAPVRNTSRGDVEWKSKNFLTRDEDDFSFIDMDEDI